MAKQAKKKSKRRDNFAPSTIRKLRDLAGNICSNPDCKVFTLGSQVMRDHPCSIGVAAHIYAAAPGGKRYDPNMSEHERKHIDNGIWLCQSCSRLIDVDEHRFSVELLRRWRKGAEERAMRSIGQPSITKQEQEIAVRRSVGQAIADFATGNSSSLGAPLGQVISGYAANLEDLDPRFKVTVAATENSITHEIYAKEPDAQFQINFDNTSEIRQAVTRLLETGEPLNVSSDSFSFSGSRLFESISDSIEEGSQTGILSIAGRSKEVDLTVTVTDGLYNELELCRLAGQMRSGSKMAVITGSALGGMFKIKVESNKKTGKDKTELQFSAETWIGKNISKLSYFPRLLKAANLLTQKSNARFEVAVDCGGKSATLTNNSGSAQQDFIQSFIWIIHHIDRIRSLVPEIGDLNFKHIDDQESDTDIDRYLALKNGSDITKKEPLELIFTAILNDDAPHSLPELCTMNDNILLTEPERELVLLGNKILPPRIQHSIGQYSACPFSRVADRKLSIAVYGIEGTTIATSLEPSPWILGKD